MLKLESQEMVTFAVGYSHNFRAHVLRALGNGCGSCKRSTRDFQRNLRCWPKRAMYCYQRTAGGDIQRRGKLQEIFAALIATADEYRNSEGQTYPLASLDS